MDSKERRPLESLDWVFAGSSTLSDGRFGADSDGTVVCVVDFENALITLPAILITLGLVLIMINAGLLVGLRLHAIKLK